MECLAGSVEVVGDVKSADKLGDGINVLVRLLAHVADNVLELLLLDGAVSRPSATGDDGGNKVTQNPRA